MSMMMSTRKATIAILLLICMVTASFAGCANDSGNEPGSLPAAPPSAPETTVADGGEEIPAGALAFSTDALPCVVVPSVADADTASARDLMVLSLESIYGKAPQTGTDRTDYDENRFEILIGNVSYAETREIMKLTPYGDWMVGCYGRKVVICSYDSGNLVEAVRSFASELKRIKTDDGVSVIPADYRNSKTVQTLMNSIPLLPGKLPGQLKKAGYGGTCVGVVFPNCTAGDYQTYLELVTGESGFRLYAEQEINENRFATYTKGDNILTVMFVPTLKRIVVEIETTATTALPGLQSENVYHSLGLDALVTQIGLRYDYDPDIWNDKCNGLSHVIRLDDGSFIIIDGGMGRASDGDRLYEIMKKQAPDPEQIVVAAWLFSHPHGDHTGAFDSFTHAAEITVERFIYNFPAESAVTQGWYASLYQKTKKEFPTAQTITAHPGQVFYLRNATVTMLNTADLSDRSFAEDISNESSLVFRVEIAGKSIMYLCDLGVYANLYFCNMYGEALKSDLVQTAHHGYEGANYRTYALIQPQYVLWNTGYIDGRMEHLLDINGNNYFSRNDSIVKWVAGGNIDVITLKENQEPQAEIFENFETYMRS